MHLTPVTTILTPDTAYTDNPHRVAYIIEIERKRRAADGWTLTVACPYCAGSHHHGVAGHELADPGTRVPHCAAGSTYALVWPTPDVLVALEDDRARCPAMSAAAGHRCRNASARGKADDERWLCAAHRTRSHRHTLTLRFNYPVETA